MRGIIRHLLLSAGAIILLWLLKEPILKIINEFVVGPVLLYFQTGFLTIISFLFISVYSICNFCKKLFFDNLRPTIKSLITATTIVVAYFLLLRNNELFYSIKIPDYATVAYSDILIPFIFFNFLHHRSYSQLQIDSNREHFIEDNFYRLIQDDVFARKHFAKKIAELINNSISEKAFAISVVGSWGAGKSVFMKLIQEELELDASNELIEFNPWKVSDLKKVIEDFFNTLSNKLKKYNTNAAKELKNYATKILALDENMFTKIANGIIDLWSDEKSIEEDFDNINDKIKATGKRFVVFIDDVDRLTGNEILQVLKLIRNSANFGNVFFIVPIDYEYVVGSMKNTQEVSLEGQYLQKIFQYELVLPPIKKDFIKKEFKRLIGFDNLLPYDQQEVDLALSHLISEMDTGNSILFELDYQGDFQLAIDNLRDLVRFTNSFKISYSILKGEVDVFDLIMIELIKLRSVKLYNLIGALQILKKTENVSPRHVIIDPEKFESHTKSIMNEVDLARCKQLTNRLFSMITTKGLRSSRSIIYPVNIGIYFNYQLFDQIPLKEFRKFQTLNVGEMVKKVKDWENEGKGPAITKLLQEFREFRDWSTFKKFTELFLILGDSPTRQEWLSHSYSFFINLETINRFASNSEEISKEQVESFLQEIFELQNISTYARSEFASFFLEKITHNNDCPFMNKQFWIDQSNLALKQFLSTRHNFTPLVYDFMFNSIVDIETDSRRIRIDSTTCKEILEFIKKNPDSYFPFVMRPVQVSYMSNTWTFDPFINDIFGSFEDFEKLLSESTSNEESVLLTKKYLPSYKAKNDKEHGFEVEEKDSKRLVELREKLNNNI